MYRAFLQMCFWPDLLPVSLLTLLCPHCHSLLIPEHVNYASTYMLCCAMLSSQSCLTLCNPVDHSPPAPSVDGNSPGKNTRVGCHALLQEIFPAQGLRSPTLQADSLPAELPGKPFHIHSYCLFSLELSFFRYVNGLLSIFRLLLKCLPFNDVSQSNIFEITIPPFLTLLLT